MTSVDRIQGLSGSLAVKAPVRAATTAAITLSGEQTVDGVAVVEGDRVLVKSQTSSVDNGIYNVSTGHWSRALDFDGANDFVQGTAIVVQQGTTYANTMWKVTTAAPVIGSALAFDQLVPGDAGTVEFTQAGEGAVTRTAQEKLREVVSVLDFGATGDGVTDDTAAIQAAHDALGVNGGHLLFPIGNYLVSSVTISKQVTIQGQGMFGGGTYILAKNAASKVFNCTGSSITIRDLCIDKSVVQSGGAYIYCDTACSVVNLQNLYMLNWYRGIHFAGIGNFSMQHLRLSTGVPTTGIGIRIDSGLEITMDDVIVQNADGSEPAAGMSVTASGDITMTKCSFIENVNGMVIQPGASAVCASLYATNCFFDNNSSYGLLIQPTSVTGTAHRGTFSGCWFSSSGQAGALLDTATVGGTIDGFEFIGCEMFLNGAHGLNVQGTGTINTKVLGGKYAQNTGAGALFGAGVDKWGVIGATLGAIAGLTGNTTYGIISTAGTSDDVLIADNTLLGNTTSALNIASTGARRRIANNGGYNPVGVTGITVGASPFSHTAGDTPETVTINAGTVSEVMVDGVAVFSQTNCSVRVAPGKVVKVTYTVAPGMVRIID